MDIYLDKRASKIYLEKGHFIVETLGEEKRYFSFENVKNILIKKDCSISSNFILKAIEKDINLYFIDDLYRIKGKVDNLELHSTTIIRQQQYLKFHSAFGKELAKFLIISKIKNQNQHLFKLFSRRNLQEEYTKIKVKFEKIIYNIKKLRCEDEKFRYKIMGFEAIASVIYYKKIKMFLPKKWEFKKRETENAKEYYNIVLNYVFGILYSKLENILRLEGLDIQFGVLHGREKANKSFLFDFIEPYRIIAWEMVFTLFSKKELLKKHFDENRQITLQGKKIIINNLYKKLDSLIEYQDKNITYLEKIRIDIKNIVEQLIKNDIYCYV